MKVFLDTNIIIGGGNCPEHVELKRKANDGEICLYIGHEICSEQSKRSTDHYFGSCNAARNQKLFKILQETKKTQQKLEALEEDEWKFWDDCQLHYPQCTFSGLISAAGVSPPELLLEKDLNNEIVFLEELITIFNIENMDAIHLMTAHSANINFFLTWDKRLIKRAGKVHWLHPKIATPFDFLQKVNFSSSG